MSSKKCGSRAIRRLHLGCYGAPDFSIAQDPSLVRPPHDSLFCVMRTMSGYIWYSLSPDDGRTWCSPRPLLRKDCGVPMPEPFCCCPMHQLADGRHTLHHHNKDGHFEGCKWEETNKSRRAAFIALAEFRPDAEQPRSGRVQVSPPPPVQ